MKDDSAAQSSPPGLKIWYGIIGAPLAFSLLELLGWLLSSGSCPRGSPAGYGGTAILSNPRAILIPVAAAAVLLSLGALAVGIGEWRRSRDEGVTHILGEWRSDFLAAAAMLVSAVFTLAVLMMSIPIFWLPQCQVMR